MTPVSFAQVRELTVQVLDKGGEGVANVVVYVTADGAPVTSLSADVVIDQIDQEFVPHISIIPVGTSVTFPNSDPVAHHVYSFSKPNQFTLPLYKGELPAPVEFAQPGYVTMGCNIHDNMVGYIAVVDSNIYALTDEHGIARLQLTRDLLNKQAVVNVWSPRLREKTSVLSAPLANGWASESVDATSDGSSGETVTFQMSRKLRPAHRSIKGQQLWKNY